MEENAKRHKHIVSEINSSLALLPVFDAEAVAKEGAQEVELERARLKRLCVPELADAICSGEAIDLSRFGLTEIARTACHSPLLKELLWKEKQYRPLPIFRFFSRQFLFHPPPLDPLDALKSPVVATAEAEKGPKRKGAPRTAWVLSAWFCRQGQSVKRGDRLFQVDLVDVSISFTQKRLVLTSEIDGIVQATHANQGTELADNHLLITFASDKEVVLHKHQVVTLEFLKDLEASQPVHFDRENSGLGAILKLEMGLGKTLVAMAHSLLQPRPACKTVLGTLGFPTLIIASKVVLPEWFRNGFNKFFGPDAVKVLYLDADYMNHKKIALLSRAELIFYDFVVVTYDTIMSACKKGGYHKCCLEENSGVVTVHPRTKAQSDNAAVKGLGILFCTPWERVFADESTRFCNHKTKTYQYLMAIYGRFKYCLSASPIINQSTDLWAQLRFCGYTGVTSAGDWKKHYAMWMETHKLPCYILSIDTADTDVHVPPIVRTERRIVLDHFNDLTYDYVKKVARQVYDEYLCGAASYAGVLKLLTRLRQACIAPYLMLPEAKLANKKAPKAKEEPKEKAVTRAVTREVKEIRVTREPVIKLEEPIDLDEVDGLEAMDVDEEEMPVDVNFQALFSGELEPWIKDRQGTAGLKSPKIVALVALVEEILSTTVDDKIVIFSMFTSALCLVREALAAYTTVQVDGSVTGWKRQAHLEKFRHSSKVRILLITTRVGCFSLNLTEANRVIFLDLWWNDAAQKQAEARCHRPGQTKTVYSYTLLTEKAEGTVEDRIVELCREKKDLSDSIFDQASFEKRSLGAANIGKLLK